MKLTPRERAEKFQMWRLGIKDPALLAAQIHNAAHYERELRGLVREFTAIEREVRGDIARTLQTPLKTIWGVILGWSNTKGEKR